MSLSIEHMKKTADELFAAFELTKFKNRLSYGYKTNLVLEFCDYVEKLEDWELLEALKSSDSDDAAQFRQMMNKGIDIWLGDLIKTIAL